MAAVVTFSQRFNVIGLSIVKQMDLVYLVCALVSSVPLFLFIVCLWLCSCLARMENSKRDSNTESTENINGRNSRRYHTVDSRISYEENHPDPSNSSRIARPRSYHQSLSVSLPPEIVKLLGLLLTNYNLT